MYTSTFVVAQQRWALDPGVLRPLFESYFDHLVSRGYRESSLNHLGHSARHFCYWLNQSDIAVAQIEDGVIKQFAAHRCSSPGYRASDIMSTALVGCVRKFVGFLRQRQIRLSALLGADA